jgi:hypothetical protein
MIREKLIHHLWTRLDDKTTHQVIEESKQFKITISAMMRHIVEEYFRRKK